MTRTLLTLALLVGCTSAQDEKVKSTDTGAPAPQDTGGEGPVGDDTGDDSGLPLDPPASITLHAPEGVVLDPKLDGEPALNLTTEADETGCALGVQIDNGIGQVRTLSGTDVDWDGRDDEGAWFDPGPARAQASVDCGHGVTLSDTLILHIIRLGILSMDLHSPEGSDGSVDLAFHKIGMLTGEVSPIGVLPEYLLSTGPGAAAGAVDDDHGQPRTEARWTNPDSPPWASGTPAAHNVPAAFVASSEIQATVTLGPTAVSDKRHISVPAIGPSGGAVPEIRMAGSADAIHLGEAMTVDLDPAIATMGREIRVLQWTFESVDSAGHATPIPGHIETSHTLYTLAGQPALLDGTAVGAAPDITWIGVLEDTADALEGVEAEPAAVLDAMRDYLFEHEYIIYDPGDGAYTDFTGPYIYWSSITADLTGFLDRTSGLNLYCHSMSCLLSALSGSVGVEAEQIVLGVGFYTNQTRAAGTEDWRRWSFNSHSVVTPDGGTTIWDSSIALDGDDDPDSEPIEEVMPRGMDGAEYFWRLTYDAIEIVNNGLCYIR